MDGQEKKEGKSTVDLLGSYFGKSGASWLTQAFVLIFGTLNNALPLIAVAHLAICGLWTRSTAQLGGILAGDEAKQQAASAKQKAEQEEADKAAKDRTSDGRAPNSEDLPRLVKQLDPESPLYPSRYSRELELQWMWNRD